MGISSSRPVEKYNPDMPYFALIFRTPNEIRLVMAPPTIVDIVKTAAQAVDKDALQYDGQSHKGWYEFHFKNWMFHELSLSGANLGRELAIRLLVDLHNHGWQLALSSRMSRWFNYVTWYFRPVPVERPIHTLICVAISQENGLITVGCDEPLFQTILQTCRDVYRSGITDVQAHSPSVREIKLAGTPWLTTVPSESVAARQLILAIVKQLHQLRFRLYDRSDLNDSADSLFFTFDPESPLVENEFFCLSLNSRNLLRLINCSMDVVSIVTEAVRLHWPQGVADVVRVPVDGGSQIWEIRIAGEPFYVGRVEAVQARYLICMLLEMLLNRGWCVLTSLNVSRKEWDNAVFIFRNCKPAAALHACLDFFGDSRLNIIRGDKTLNDIVHRLALTKYPPGVTEEKFEKCEKTLVFRGYPFFGRTTPNAKAMHMAVLSCYWLYEFAKNGWSVACSADVSARMLLEEGRCAKYDVQSWFLTFCGSESQK